MESAEPSPWGMLECRLDALLVGVARSGGSPPTLESLAKAWKVSYPTVARLHTNATDATKNALLSHVCASFGVGIDVVLDFLPPADLADNPSSLVIPPIRFTPDAPPGRIVSTLGEVLDVYATVFHERISYVQLARWVGGVDAQTITDMVKTGELPIVSRDRTARLISFFSRAARKSGTFRKHLARRRLRPERASLMLRYEPPAIN